MTVNYRPEFEIPRDICYLNAAYMGVQPRRVLAATHNGATRRSQPWRIKPEDFFSHVEALRSAFAHQVNCSPDNVAIVPSASFGVSSAAAHLSLNSGDVILAMQDQFPSNYYAWRKKALTTGAEIHIVNREAGQSWGDALLEAIGNLEDRVKIAALEGHHWASADVVDLEKVIPALRQIGAHTVLDLTQTIGACPVDLSELKPDFMVAAGYKWQFCPYGVAFFYVADRYLDGEPIEYTWMNRKGADDFSRLAEFTDDYQVGARRYDVGEKSSFSNIEGALAALQLLDEWSIETISDELSKTNNRIAAILERHGFEVVSAENRGPHFQGARLPNTDPRQLATRLVEERVYASVRGDHLRVAPHLYTDDEDLERFDRVLRGALG